MKKIVVKKLLPLFFVALTFALGGCDLFEDADDITFEIVLPLEFDPVNESLVSSSPVSYSDVENLDARDNDQVAKYKDKIKQVTLNRITYVISDYAAPEPVTFTNGALTVPGKTLASASNLNLQSTTETELPNVDQAGFDEFAKQIKANQNVDVTVAGTFSRTPVAFKVTAYFHVTIVANALD
jgi:hypothetical protein